MPDYVASEYTTGEGCNCCYGPDGCTVTFKYYFAGSPGAGARPGYTIQLEGPTPCIGTYKIFEIEAQPSIVTYSGPPGPPPPRCPEPGCVNDVGTIPDDAVVTFGPTSLPIGCCDCKIKICIDDVVPYDIIYPGSCDPQDLPVIGILCNDYAIDIIKDGTTVDTIGFTFDFMTEQMHLFLYSTGETGRCLEIRMLDICNLAP